jgi:ribonuclease D
MIVARTSETDNRNNDAVNAPIAISKDELNKLPIRAYEGPIRLINDRDQVKSCVKLLESESIIGFDTETRPAFERGVSYPPALLQLATQSEVFVFQFQALGGLGALRSILENPAIIKAGVALSDDIKQLNDCWKFTPRCFIEIGTMAKTLGYKQTGLRSLAGLLLGFRISKKEQRSNWAKVHLTRSQITYAATDAWVSRELYLTIMNAWGDRSPPGEVDPLTPALNQSRESSGNKSPEHRTSRKRGKSETTFEHTPDLPGMSLPDAVSS